MNSKHREFIQKLNKVNSLDFVEVALELKKLIRSKKMLKLLYKLRNRAYGVVHQAIRNGKLVNLKSVFVLCADCATKRATDYDHRDYTRPLEVEPVCRSCNKKRGWAIEPNYRYFDEFPEIRDSLD